MSQRLVLLPEAENDVAAAAEYYDKQRPGLSLQFRAALDQTLAAIAENSKLFTAAARPR